MIKNPSIELNQSRVLLTKLRGGDYLHPGDEEAIEMIIRKVLAFKPSIKTGKVLDVGSGLGGTANYLYQQGFKHIYGVDLDAAAVYYSQSKYPYINFRVEDALKIHEQKFGFVYMINVAYAIQDKDLLIKAITKASMPGAALAISDYTATTNDGVPSADLSGKLIYPINISSMTKILEQYGWKILEITDITENYITWYSNLLQNLYLQQEALSDQFSTQDLLKVQNTFESLLSLLKQNVRGGAIIYAKFKEPSK